MMRHSRSSQKGFTLIELMISILISTIILGVALTQLIGSRTLFALQEADSRIEENARYALEVLTKNIRVASYTDIRDATQASVTGKFFNLNCDATLFNPCTDDGTVFDPTTRTYSSDHFAVWYNPPATREVDCSGRALVAGANTVNSIANIFYIAADTLRCRSYSIDSSNNATLIANSDQAIVEGVDNMQILYGITDQSFESTVPVRYISADTVDAIADDAALRDKWASIVSVRVTILASTGVEDGADNAASRTYSISDAPNTITYSDGNRRKIFSSTTAINNANL